MGDEVVEGWGWGWGWGWGVRRWRVGGEEVEGWGMYLCTCSGNVFFCCFFFCMVLPGMTQLTRKSPIALRLILRGSPGPTA